MKVLLLDVYPEVPFRISKDTNGGYGTVNNFGSGVVSKLLSRIVAKEVDWPPMDLMYTGAIVRDSGNEVNYSRILDHCDFEDIACTRLYMIDGVSFLIFLINRCCFCLGCWSELVTHFTTMYEGHCP